MRRACFGAVIGENRLMRTYDVLGWTTWGWTPVLGTDVASIREVRNTFGENVIALCDLIGGSQAIYHSPNSGDSWAKVLQATEIYDICDVGYNWTLAATSSGWYQSLTSGWRWETLSGSPEWCSGNFVFHWPGAGPIPLEDGSFPIGKSMVWVLPDHLFAHTGTEIWLSTDKGQTWALSLDLTAIPGYVPSTTHSIDGYQGRIIATCGRALVETTDLGDSWAAVNLATAIRDWRYISPALPIFRQVAFWDTTDPSDPDKSKWLLSTSLFKTNIIRTYINRGTGVFSPILDMLLSERHRINVSAIRRAGADITDHSITVSGDRRFEGEMLHAMAVSTDGLVFTDVLGGGLGSRRFASNATLDHAYALIADRTVG